MKKETVILLLFLSCIGAAAETPALHITLQGTVRDAVDGEPLIGVTIFIPELKATTITDINGHYKLENLPQKTITLQVSYVGHQTIIKEVDLAKTTNVDFTMHESNAMMNEVVVTGIA